MSQSYPPHGYPGGAPGFGAHPAPAGPPPDNYLVWAVLTTIFCFMPLGIVSIVKSTEVNFKWSVGDFAGAYRASQEAKKWAKWSAYVSIGTVAVVFVIYAIIIAIAVTTTAAY